MQLYEMTVHELLDVLKNKEASTLDITSSFISQIDKKEPDISAFVNLYKDEALKKARQLQDINSIGIPIGIKDNINVKGTKTTCSSKMLENYTSPYDATVIEHLKNTNSIILGKLNMDEFAMGASTEYSAFKITKNPYDLTRVPGGSSGGSAAAVASNMVPWALRFRYAEAVFVSPLLFVE